MNSSILKGITVLEINGLAPVQFCGQILSDFGARVIRVDKIDAPTPIEELLGNNKLSVALDLKSPGGIEVLKRLSSRADVILEPFRAGVMERMGLGPDVLLKHNKRLIYTRLSGYGQSGPLSKLAGHDINYLANSGVLSLLGWDKPAPEPPCNIIGDFGGGSVLGALGVMMALYERERSGLGQVVDVSIMRGSAYLASWIFGVKPHLWTEPRGKNLLDGGSYMYNVYETKDGKWMAVGSLEKKFYDNVLIGLNLTSDECPYFCPSGKEIFIKKFKEKTQEEWIQIFKDLDACVAPILTVDEAADQCPENYVRTHGHGDNVPKPEPKFSRSDAISSATLPPPEHGEHTVNILKEIGYRPHEILSLANDNAIYFPNKSKL